MNQDPIYAVIDLGSSEIRGMIAYKLDKDRVSPIAYSSVSAENAIRYGCIYNLNKASEKIATIVKELNEALPDNYEIKKLYIGVGGQSLHSHPHRIGLSMDSPEGEEITQEHLDRIEQELQTLHVEGKELLHVARPQYLVNGKIEKYPKGIHCRSFEACYQLIMARNTVLRNIKTVVEERLGLELAQVLVSPICEAEVTLIDEEKTLGIAYVNIGASCTSVVIYKRDLLMHLRVLPMGGKNITQDLTALRILPAEAEELKIHHAVLKNPSEKNITITLPSADGLSERTVSSTDIYCYVYARMKEITANYLSIIDRFNETNSLGRGIVISGGGAQLNQYKEQMHENRQYVRFAEVRPDKVEYNAVCSNPSLRTCIGLAYAATKTCIGVEHTDLDSLFNRDYTLSGTENETLFPSQSQEQSQESTEINSASLHRDSSISSNQEPADFKQEAVKPSHTDRDESHKDQPHKKKKKQNSWRARFTELVDNIFDDDNSYDEQR